MEQKLELLTIAAGNPQAKASRHLLLQELPKSVTTLGLTLRTAGAIMGRGRVDGSSPFGNGEDGLVAIGYLAEASAELLYAADNLLVADRLYAAASIGRQLLELEQLAWAFASEPDDAGDWLRSTSSKERISRWGPVQLRRRSEGRFKDADYHHHCNLGGHPTPDGFRGLVAASPDSRGVVSELLRYELCRHGSNAWHELIRGSRAFGETILPDSLTGQLDVALRHWYDTELLGHLPPTT